MKRRAAERVARRFVKGLGEPHDRWNLDIALEHDGVQHKSWSCGLRPDEEDPDYEPGRGFVFYVHADGHVEGPY